jgi:hypothetical protein
MGLRTKGLENYNTLLIYIISLRVFIFTKVIDDHMFLVAFSHVT